MTNWEEMRKECEKYVDRVEKNLQCFNQRETFWKTEMLFAITLLMSRCGDSAKIDFIPLWEDVAKLNIGGESTKPNP